MENTHIELINKFLEKKLSESEKGEFKTLFDNNQEFCKEVKYHANMIAAIKAADKFISNEEILNENHSTIRNINWYWFSAVAALILIFVVISVLIFNGKDLSNEEIYANYYSRMSGAETSMGEENSEVLISNSFNYYSAKDFTNAVKSFDLLDDSLENYRIFTGICNLELNNFSEAKLIFEEILKSESIYINDAKWYLGLTYLKLEQTAQAKLIFKEISKSTSQYSEKAKEILDEF